VITLESKSSEDRRSRKIRDDGPYSARNSSKGALIDEAGRVFTAIQNGLSVDEVREQAINGVLLSQRSSQNRKRIWTSIQQRYLVSDFAWLTSLVAEKCSESPHGQTFVSLLYLLVTGHRSVF